SPLTIYGPIGIKDYVKTSLKASQTQLTYPLIIKEITEGELFSNDLLTVHSQRLTHGVTSYGFKVSEKDRPGKLLVNKLLEKGIQPGPIFQQIKENEVTIMENGEKIYRSDFVGPSQKGRTICIMGDTKQPELATSFIQGADVLVHEATFSHKHQDLAEKYNHTTAKEAAQLAKNAQVKQLILTHISSRYQQDELITLEQEAIQIFQQSLIANDLWEFNL
ncbi:MAG TPA: MBL fold metallo-hydrolase, partial [Bacillota bacterium]|nr:MBL fold metallo-hydrolase [Bacillota bacterium]